MIYVINKMTSQDQTNIQFSRPFSDVLQHEQNNEQIYMPYKFWQIEEQQKLRNRMSDKIRVIYDFILFKQYKLQKLSQLTNYQHKMTFVCKGKKDSIYVCSSKNCSSHAFICQENQCCRQTDHKDCQLMAISEFGQHWDISRGGFDNYMQKLCALYEGLLKRINYDYTDLKHWAEVHHQRQADLKRYVDNPEFILSGDYLSKMVDVWNVFSEDHWADVEQQFVEIDSLVQRQLNSIKKIYTRARKRAQHKRKSSTHNQIEINSSIVWKQDQLKSLFRLLGTEHKIRSLDCLYKATLNNFSAQEFHKSCDGSTNTVVLLKNSKGKVLGGFTPLSWGQDQLMGEYKTDPDQRSFVFSLNSEQRYPLFEKEYAIQCNKFCGPFFGRGATLWIYDRADINSAYWHILPTSYHPSAGMWTEQSFEDFIGAKMYQKFTILEWEVFQVVYE